MYLLLILLFKGAAKVKQSVWTKPRQLITEGKKDLPDFLRWLI